jgi:glutamate-1-semialdehyde 2,1-aminomutase
MRHPGTYNANPLSAAAGVAALKLVSTGEPCRQANEAGRVLRNRLNKLFADRNWPWIAYIDFAMFKLIPMYDGPRAPEASEDNNGLIPYEGDLNRLDGPPANPKLRHAFRQAMLLNGVDVPGFGGWLMATHTEEDINRTVNAVARSIEMLAE